ncbi:unnamed protein product [Urochloa humidicola]
MAPAPASAPGDRESGDAALKPPDPPPPTTTTHLSPYLFLLVADVLQTMIKRDRCIRHPLSHDAACPTLQYADDTLIVVRGEKEDVKQLKSVLDLFSVATGLKINYNKSTAVPMNMNTQVSWDAGKRDSLKPTSAYRCRAPSSSSPLLTPTSAEHMPAAETHSPAAFRVDLVMGGVGVSARCIATMDGEMTGTHWESLRTLLPLYQAITTVKLGDGRTTSFWQDVWEGEDSLESRFPSLYSHYKGKQQTVHTIATAGLERHLVPRLTPTAQSELQSVNQLLRRTALTAAPVERQSPFMLPDGRLQSSTLYKMLKAASHGEHSPTAAFVWHNNAPPRVRFFTWLLTNDRIQSKANLRRKTIVDDDTCDFCNDCTETSDHIMFQCPTACAFWQAHGYRLSLHQHVQDLHQMRRPSTIPAQEHEMFIILCCWQLCQRRNEMVFRGTHLSLTQLLQSFREEAQLWGCRLARSKKGVSNAWCSAFVNAM